MLNVRLSGCQSSSDALQILCVTHGKAPAPGEEASPALSVFIVLLPFFMSRRFIVELDHSALEFKMVLSWNLEVLAHGAFQIQILSQRVA